jgi:NAD+ diphosphatase
MLTTPASFVSLLAAQEHPTPHNFVFRGDELLVREADLALPDAAGLALHGAPAADFFPVGLLQAQYCHTTWLDKSVAPAEGFVFRKLRALFGAMDEARLAIAGRAFQIADWARTHRFCGACGTPTAHVAGERCVKCPACGMVAYPRISPAMMVLIKRGDSILLARHTHSPAPFFTALAGFVEAGESIEETVHREVFEEVGLKVRDLRYYASQPWPFPHSLMIAFTAEYESGEIRVDESEIAEARWFGPGDDIPRTPHGISVASHLINAHLPRAKA